ncbi:hypothetical protein ACMGGR_08235 [Erwinia sp. BNK-24-b]|uniref:hypothetical protein n=1 Tax=unclassified Erwinia TaxID=2622719 RepID=UPI0039BFE6DB
MMGYIKEKLVMEIGNADSISEALILYKNFYQLIPEYKFVFSSPKGPYPGFECNKKFKHGAAIRSLFNDENVVVFDPLTFEEMFSSKGCSTFRIDYSISLDSQALSYLQSYINGKKHNHENDIEEVFKFIVKKETQVDSILYEMENLMNLDNPENHPKIFDKLLGYQFIRNINPDVFEREGGINASISKNELFINTDAHFKRMMKNSQDLRFREGIKFRHSQVYIYLLMMSIIQISSPSRSLKNKMLEMLSFAHNKAGFLATREIMIAKEFFERGTKFPFFSKIHKNSKKLWSALNGMVWDLTHYRYLEQAITFNMGNDERYFFPGIISYDKGFIEVMELTPLKTVAFNTNGNIPIPFYDVGDGTKITGNIKEIRNYYNELCSDAKRKERETSRELQDNNFASLILELEKTLESVANVPR